MAGAALLYVNHL